MAAITRPGIVPLFALLILAQAAHSLEEYAGRLWEVFPPALALTGLVSSDRELGFLLINLALGLFGLWCLVWPVLRRWQSATALMWFWIALEGVNGVGHPAWAAWSHGYQPGLITALVLLPVSVALATQLLGASRRRMGAT